MVTCEVASKLRLFRLRAKIGCTTFSILLATAVLSCVHLQLQCTFDPSPPKKILLSWGFQHIQNFFTGTLLVRFDLTSYILQVLHLTHYTTGDDIVEMLLMYSFHTFHFK